MPKSDASGSFGQMRHASNGLAAAQSEVLLTCAGNLLDKAVRAIEAGDPGRTDALLDRAVALPYDEHEESLPAYWSAHMRLFCAVTDGLEATAEGDEAWLARCLAVVETLAAGGMDYATGAMYDVLTVVLQDFQLTAAEGSAIRRVLPLDWDRGELGRRAVQDPSARKPIVSQTLHALLSWNHCSPDFLHWPPAEPASGGISAG